MLASVPSSTSPTTRASRKGMLLSLGISAGSEGAGIGEAMPSCEDECAACICGSTVSVGWSSGVRLPATEVGEDVP